MGKPVIQKPRGGEDNWREAWLKPTRPGNAGAMLERDVGKKGAEDLRYSTPIRPDTATHPPSVGSRSDRHVNSAAIPHRQVAYYSPSWPTFVTSPTSSAATVKPHQPRPATSYNHHFDAERTYPQGDVYQPEAVNRQPPPKHYPRSTFYPSYPSDQARRAEPRTASDLSGRYTPSSYSTLGQYAHDAPSTLQWDASQTESQRPTPRPRALQTPYGFERFTTVDPHFYTAATLPPNPQSASLYDTPRAAPPYGRASTRDPVQQSYHALPATATPWESVSWQAPSREERGRSFQTYRPAIPLVDDWSISDIGSATATPYSDRTISRAYAMNQTFPEGRPASASDLDSLIDQLELETRPLRARPTYSATPSNRSLSSESFRLDSPDAVPSWSRLNTDHHSSSHRPSIRQHQAAAPPLTNQQTSHLLPSSPALCLGPDSHSTPSSRSLYARPAQHPLYPSGSTVIARHLYTPSSGQAASQLRCYQDQSWPYQSSASRR